MAKKMTAQNGEGTHYHYHYYGYGAPEVADAAPTPPQPGTAAPPPAAGGPGFNLHRHPSADSLVKGLLIGAGATFLLTNETAQRAIIRSVVHVWSAIQGGIEEVKERVRDAEAEVAEADPAADTADRVG